MDAAYELYIFSGGSWRLQQRITEGEGGKTKAVRLAEIELGKSWVEGAIVVREMFDEAKGEFTEAKIFRRFKREDLPTLGGSQKGGASPGFLPGRPMQPLAPRATTAGGAKPAGAPTRTVPPRAAETVSQPPRPKSEVKPKPVAKKPPAEKEEKSSLLTLLGGMVSKVVDIGADDKPAPKRAAVPSGGERSGIRLGRYDIIGELGKGAMGVVYKAYDPVIDRPVAIKTINKQMVDVDETDALSRLRREAQSAGRLSHPNIVSIYDYGENERFAYIAMEFIEGRPLNTVLAEEGMTPQRAISVMRQLLAALDYSHDRKVIHRDIKPANIMVMPGGLVKITDFGIARVESSTLTQTGAFIGTPAYMSPEQVRGEQADARSDLFSAAVVFYELLSGQRPFTGSGTALAYQIVSTTAPRITQINSRVPGQLSDVVEMGMAKDPAERYQTARAFQHAIDEVVGKFRALASGQATDTAATSTSTGGGAKKPWYERWTFEAGREIFAEGDDGDACYVIESGVVEVVKRDPVTGQEIVLAQADRGKVIGEMALIDNKPRMASVRTVEDTVLLVVPRDAFQNRLEKLDPVTRRLLDTFTERLRAMADEMVRLKMQNKSD